MYIKMKNNRVVLLGLYKYNWGLVFEDEVSEREWSFDNMSLGRNKSDERELYVFDHMGCQLHTIRFSNTEEQLQAYANYLKAKSFYKGGK